MTPNVHYHAPEEFATCPCQEPDEYTQLPPILFLLRVILLPCSHPHLGLLSGLFPSGFYHQNPLSVNLVPIRSTCPVHL